MRSHGHDGKELLDKELDVEELPIESLHSESLHRESLHSESLHSESLHSDERESWEEFSRRAWWEQARGFPSLFLERLKLSFSKAVLRPLSAKQYSAELHSAELLDDDQQLNVEGLETDEREGWEEFIRPPLWKRVLLFPFLIIAWLIRGIVIVITFPFISLNPAQRRMFLWGIPALLCMAMVVNGVFFTWMNQDTIKRRYVSRMQEAINLKDFNLASVLAERIIQDSDDVDQPMRFAYAMVLAEKGDREKSLSIINDLAPDDEAGFAGAHQFKAGMLAKELQQHRDEESLRKFRWHLENADTKSSEQIETLWAVYYSIANQEDKVVEHMERASRINPSHLITLSEMYRKQGKTLEADRTLVEAEKIFDRQLQEDPLTTATRLKLSLIKSKLRKMDEAEQLLLTGVALNSDSAIRRSAADFYLMRFDSLRGEKQPFEKQFAYLQKSIAIDSSYMPAYDRLVSLYASCPDTESVQKLKQLLRDMIVEGKSSAMAHFALSSVLLLDGDANESESHLRQSFKLDARMPVVCNNLAWILANNSNANQLAEAYQLATQAVSAEPKNAEFRDTLGLVLMKQEKYEEAIAEFEKVLPAAGSKKPVHRNLANCYQKLGREEMANSHAEKGK